MLLQYFTYILLKNYINFCENTFYRLRIRRNIDRYEPPYRFDCDPDMPFGIICFYLQLKTRGSND